MDESLRRKSNGCRRVLPNASHNTNDNDVFHSGFDFPVSSFQRREEINYKKIPLVNHVVSIFSIERQLPVKHFILLDRHEKVETIKV